MLTRLGTVSSGTSGLGGTSLHFKDVWATFRDNLWIVAGCFVVVISTVSLVTFSQPKIYETRTQVLLKTRLAESPLPGMRQMENTVAPQSAYDVITFFNSQQMIVRSTVLAERTIERHPRLLEYPALKNASNPAAVLRGMISTRAVERTQIFDIIATGNNPKMVADVANAVAETYSVYNYEMLEQATRNIYNILHKKLDMVREKVATDHEDLRGLAQEEELARPKDTEAINDAKIARISQELAAIVSQRTQAEVALTQIRESRNNGTSLFEIPIIASNQIISVWRGQLANLEVEYFKLRERLREKHPEVIEQAAKIQATKEKIDIEMHQVVATLENDYRNLVNTETLYRAELETVKEDSFRLQKRLDRYSMEASQVKVVENAYNVLLERLTEADVLEGLQTNIVSILEPAVPPRRPISPKVAVNLMFAFLFSAFISVGVVVAKEYLDTSIRTPDDIVNLKVPVMTMIPHTSDNDEGRSSIREAFNSLRTALLFARGDAEQYVLLVTSGAPKEGKTMVSTNIGKVLASAGESVILVDCDFRRPMLHNKFNLDRRKGGATSYILGAEGADLDSLIRNAVPNLDVLPCGPIPPDPSKLLGSPKMRELVDRLKAKYRWVIIDSPPVTGLSDSLILAAMCDAVTIVMRRHVLDRALAQRAVEQLRAINPNLLGVVFNDVDFRSAYYARYYKYGGYYSPYYYTSSEEQEKERMAPVIDRLRKSAKKESDAASPTTFFDS